MGKLCTRFNYISIQDQFFHHSFFCIGSSISLWGLMRKKPLYSIESAHGRDALSSLPNWISSIACLQNSDLFATGKSSFNVLMNILLKECPLLSP